MAVSIRYQDLSACVMPGTISAMHAWPIELIAMVEHVSVHEAVHHLLPFYQGSLDLDCWAQLKGRMLIRITEMDSPARDGSFRHLASLRLCSDALL